MSRFGPHDPFYRAMAEAESNARIERLIKADAERYRELLVKVDADRYRRQMNARPLYNPIIDRDPGDEDTHA